MTFSRVRSVLETTLSVFMLVVFALFIGFIVVSFGIAYPLPFILICVLSIAISVFYRYKRRPHPNSSRQESSWPHRGILVNKFSPTGLPGLVFALGAVFMLWFGVPAFRSIMIGAVIIGGVIGIILIVWRRP